MDTDFSVLKMSECRESMVNKFIFWCYNLKVLNKIQYFNEVFVFHSLWPILNCCIKTICLDMSCSLNTKITLQPVSQNEQDAKMKGGEVFTEYKYFQILVNGLLLYSIIPTGFT